MSTKKDRDIYRAILVRMWADGRFLALTPAKPSGEALWMWLLCGPRTTQLPGVIVGGIEELAGARRWPVQGFAQALTEIVDQGMAKVDPVGLIWLPNGIKHNRPQSTNAVRGWRNQWMWVPECALKTEVYHDLRGFTQAMGKPWLKAFDEACPEPYGIQEQEQEQEQEPETGSHIPAPTPRGRAKQLTITSAPAVPVRFDLDRIYQAYPRKKGKDPGLRKLRTLIKTQADYDTILVAAEAEGAAWAHIPPGKRSGKHFSTWVSAKAWLDEEPPRAWTKGDQGQRSNGPTAGEIAQRALALEEQGK